MRPEFNLPHLLVAHSDLRGVLSIVEFRFHSQARFRCRGSDQVDDNAMACQRPPPPVHGDVIEQAVLDLVPLACPRREVANRRLKAGFVGESLQFPHFHSRVR